ncbi:MULTISPECIES: glycosyl hydrolase family 18 protein [Pantoea]|uniref:GH18 domain-containing protein n=1 Tax=Candidatus Pantoea gossypiicola TaxID=2608008 RepID=A0AB34CF97_9GAMM|nr:MULTISPECIES: glycosyl hydrolase family 18 protein [Pantoea]KAA5921495.1 hypothetical protein F3I59_22845 [Pantoea sp. VH_8]KAA5927916.1 hypothetical protein F3I58_23105 [Pantoea sp. VH_4]KAA5978523.1 hypothetical protein F3I49_22835 [Pantoea sp. M_4]KAA6121960.1 hypothetical protein F3I20_17425 [Pantoea gossypiicola]
MKKNYNKRAFIKKMLIISAVALFQSACCSRKNSPNKDEKPVPSLSNSLWLPNWRMQKSLQSALNAIKYGHVETVSPFWYELDNNGDLVEKPGSEGLTIPDEATTTLLQKSGARVLPTITTTLMPDNFIELYSDLTRQQKLARVIRETVLANGYDGIDLDLENIALTTDIFVAQTVRNVFTSLCRIVSSELAEADKLLSITVMPRWSDRYEIWRNKLIPAVYDYNALSRTASVLRIMAYDQHAPNTPPGPIAGFEWVKSICYWTRHNVFSTAQVEIGIPLYGRHWGAGKVVSVLYDDMTELRKRFPLNKVIYSTNEREETLSWVDAAGAPHTVWYSSDRSVEDRVALIKSYGFRGGAFWAASYESPSLWKAPALTFRAV